MSATQFYKSLTLCAPGKLLPVLVNTMVVAGLIYMSVMIGSKILELLQPAPARPDSTVSLQVPGTTPPSEPEKPDASEDIAALHLFGQADKKAAEEAVSHKAAPETRLDLTLRGIFAGDQVDHGFAIIQNNHDKQERYFTIKQTVFSVATLEEIYDDRVILLHGGKYETLRLPKQSLSREHFYDSSEVRAEKKRVATNYRDRLLSRDGMDLIKLFGFEEAYKGGGFIGFRVKALGEEGLEMMEILGIEDGDLVTVLNGKRFSDGLEAFEEIKILKKVASIDIIIDRNGNEIPFHFDLDTPVDASPDTPAGETTVVTPSGTGTTTSGAEQALDSGLSTNDSNANLASEDDESDAGIDWDNARPAGAKRSSIPKKKAKPKPAVNWDDTEGAAEYRAKQKARTIESNKPLEYDH